MDTKTLFYIALITSKKIAKILVHIFFEIKASLSRNFVSVKFQTPPYIHMRRTGGKSFSHYYEAGMKSQLPIVTLALRNGICFEKPIKILDFGCGVARQLLHFTRDYPVPSYYACDVNRDTIDFIRRYYPQVKSYCNDFTPPLVYEANFFDMVYSVSIFSHLDMESQATWLAELFRIVRPGGLCFITTQGRTSLSRMMLEEPAIWRADSPEILKDKGCIYREYKDFEREKIQENILKLGSKYYGIEKSYGSMVVSFSHIKAKWPVFGFELIDFVEGVIDGLQDLVVLKKK